MNKVKKFNKSLTHRYLDITYICSVTKNRKIMYVLSNLGEPFAIVENNTNMRIEKAIAEEFLLEQVTILADEDFKLPDWGESKDVYYTGITDEQSLIQGEVVITKLVKY